jgi:Zn-dependent protease
MAQLQMLAVLLNLVPIPPLDGFNAISPALPLDLRRKLITPPTSTFLFLGFFLVLWTTPAPVQFMYDLTRRLQTAMGFDYASIEMMRQCFNLALFGSNN